MFNSLFFKAYSDKEILQTLRKGSEMEVEKLALYLFRERFINIPNTGAARSKLPDKDERNHAYGYALTTFVNKLKGGLELEVEDLDAFFTKIFNDKCIDILRKHTAMKVRLTQAGPSPIENLEPVFQKLSGEAQNSLAKLLARLDLKRVLEELKKMGNCFDLIVMQKIDGFSYQEIAPILGLTPEAARTRTSQCLKQLRNNLQGELNFKI
ncbi:MAG: hypothetical protein R2830_21110 [Saprospiraceae bacterium]